MGQDRLAGVARRPLGPCVPRGWPGPRAEALRPEHSFASLLLAEGRQPLYVAKQLGHSLAVLLSTYAHLIDEYAERQPIDAETEIAKARKARVLGVCRGA